MSKSSVASLVLKGQPSCIEIVPNQQHYAVVGTYELKESHDHHKSQALEAQERTGSLQLIQFTDTSLYVGTRIDVAVADDVSTVIEIVNEEHGILDLHFSPYHSSILCTANSTGSLTFRRVTDDNGAVRIKQSPGVEVLLIPDDTSILVLSLQWHPKQSSNLACTLSNGHVLLVTVGINSLLNALNHGVQEPSKQSIITATQVVLSHSLEAWTSAFTPSGDAILSGGDDCLLQYTTVPSAINEAKSASPQPVWSNRKMHGAGVTAILPLDETTFVTGSYDDHIRVIDSGSGKSRMVAELHLGGGVWRLRQMSTDAKVSNGVAMLLLASCMHVGVRIVKLTRSSQDAWTLEVCDSFEEHQSMNYGSGFIMPNGTQATTAVISTSFYDRLVCLWYASSP